MNIVAEARRQHPKARHHCFAYRLGADKNLFRYNDDGEPSGTAGKPILGQIDAFDLSDVVVVVSRYFGGKLLGASGLANAYKLSAQDALSQATVYLVEQKVRYEVHFSYEVMGTLMDALARYDATIDSRQFAGAAPKLTFSLPLSHPGRLLDQIIAHALGLYPEEVDGKRTFKQLRIEEESRDG